MLDRQFEVKHQKCFLVNPVLLVYYCVVCLSVVLFDSVTYCQVIVKLNYNKDDIIQKC